MTKLEQAQAIAEMARAIADDRADESVVRGETPLEDARAAWLGLRRFMEVNEMVFYRP